MVSRLPPVTRRLVGTRFRCGSGPHGPQPRQRRQLVGSLCKRHAVTPEGAPTACRRTVSGTVSLRYARCFSPFPHGTGSLSVSCEYLALADGPAGFTQDSSCPALLRVPLRLAWLRVRDFHPLRSGFPDASTRHVSCDVAALQPPHGRNRAGLGSSPFARHYWGNHCYFLFLRVLRCFSSPRSPPSSEGWQAFSLPGCPIRKSADQRSFAPPRGLSQLITSFIACKSLGIHRTPFLTCSTRRVATVCLPENVRRRHFNIVPCLLFLQFAWFCSGAASSCRT